MEDQSLKILLVEDHMVVQKVTCMLLRKAGCIVDLAESGQKALESFYQNTYHLILLDIGLPDIDGLSIAETIRNSEDPEKSKTPIAIVTAHSDKDYRERAHSVGVGTYIVKPFTEKVRHQLMQQVLQIKISCRT